MVFKINFQVFSRLGAYLAAGSIFKFTKTNTASADPRDTGGTQCGPRSGSPGGRRRRREICVEGYELKMVQVLVRHGARTPLHIIHHDMVEQARYDRDLLMRTLPYTDFQYKPTDLAGGPKPASTYDAHYLDKTLKGGALYGVLTTTGQEQAYTFGLLLQKQYISEAGLIDDVFNPSQIYVRSTNTRRTVDTARCVVAGMFGSRNLNSLTETPRIHIDMFNKDALLMRTGFCNVLRRINKAARIHGADMPEFRQDRATIEKLFGIDPSSGQKVNFMDMHDDIIAREAHGFSVPACLQPYRDMVIRNAIKLKYYAYCGQHEAERPAATKLSAGPSITMLIDNMENADDSSPRLYILSCHDTTLVALLGALQLFDFVWPPFTADLRLELYENRDHQKFVRLSYNGEDKIMPGASSELCPLEEFKSLVAPLLVTDKDYSELCNSDILEQIAKELVEAEKGDKDDEEDEIPAGM